MFGWTTLDLGGGAEMWTLPGYGDHLESDTTRTSASRWRRSGGPKGFEDVVASINPIPDDQPDTPAHWSVTFAVDDADAIAAKATELGGKVIVAAVRRPLGPDDGHQRPAGRDVHRQQVRPENKDLGS